METPHEWAGALLHSEIPVGRRDTTSEVLRDLHDDTVQVVTTLHGVGLGQEVAHLVVVATLLQNRSHPTHTLQK